MNAHFIDNLEAAGKLAASIAHRSVQQLAQSTNYRLREQIMTVITGSISDGVREALMEAGYCDSEIARCQAMAADAFIAELARLRAGVS